MGLIIIFLMSEPPVGKMPMIIVTPYCDLPVYQQVLLTAIMGSFYFAEPSMNNHGEEDGRARRVGGH